MPFLKNGKMHLNSHAKPFIVGIFEMLVSPISVQTPLNILLKSTLENGCVGAEADVKNGYVDLFCLFAEDTTIFERCQLQDYIETNANADVSDSAHHLSSMFYVVNTTPGKRLKIWMKAWQIFLM